MKTNYSKFVFVLTAFVISCAASSTATAATVEGAVWSNGRPGFIPAVGAEVRLVEVTQYGSTIAKKNGRVFVQKADRQLSRRCTAYRNQFSFQNIPKGNYMMQFNFRNPYDNNRQEKGLVSAISVTRDTIIYNCESYKTR